MTSTTAQVRQRDRAGRFVGGALLWLVVLLVGLVTLTPALHAWIDGDEIVGKLRFEPNRDNVPEYPQAIDRNMVWWSGEMSVSLDSPTVGQRLADLAPGLVATGYTAALVVLIQRLLAAVRTGAPLDTIPARILQRISLVSAGALLLLPVAHSVRETTFASGLEGPVDLFPNLPWGILLALGVLALVAASLARAFRRAQEPHAA